MDKNKRKAYIKMNIYNKAKLAALTGALIVTGCAIKGCIKEGISEGDELTLKSTTTIVSDDSDKEYEDFADILKNADINETKKEVLTKVWNHLVEMNTKMSPDHLELAKEFDEAVSEYLIYSEIFSNNDVISKLFDKYSLNKEKLVSDYNTVIEKEKLSNYIISENTNNLIVGDDYKEFYKKYENLLIKYKTINSDQKMNTNRKNVTDEFYKNLREDFIDNQSNYKQKFAIIPIVKAFNMLSMDIDSSYKLDSSEENEFYDDKYMSSRLNNVFLVIASNTDVSRHTDDEFTYQELRDIAISELKTKNIACTGFIAGSDDEVLESDELEDINTEENTVIDTNKNEDSNVVATSTPNPTSKPITNNSNNSNSNNNKSNSSSNPGIIDDKDNKSDEVPSWIKKDSKDEKKKKEENKNKNKNNNDKKKSDKKNKIDSKENPGIIDDDDNKSDKIPNWILENNKQESSNKKQNSNDKTTSNDSNNKNSNNTKNSNNNNTLVSSTPSPTEEPNEVSKSDKIGIINDDEDEKEDTNTKSGDISDNSWIFDEEVPQVEEDTPEVDDSAYSMSLSMNSSYDIQEYYNAIATQIVENMANESVSTIEKSLVK